METVIKFGGEKSKGVVFGDGVDDETRAFGLFGGRVGSINELEFRFPDGSCHYPKSKEIVSEIPNGTIMRQVAGGGGGYGDGCAEKEKNKNAECGMRNAESKEVGSGKSECGITLLFQASFSDFQNLAGYRGQKNRGGRQFQPLRPDPDYHR